MQESYHTLCDASWQLTTMNVVRHHLQEVVVDSLLEDFVKFHYNPVRARGFPGLHSVYCTLEFAGCNRGLELQFQVDGHPILHVTEGRLFRPA